MKRIFSIAFIIGCSVFVSANTSKGDCKNECPNGGVNCVCVPTPGGGCVCVPKAQVTQAQPVVKEKSSCPNTPDCICE